MLIAKRLSKPMVVSTMYIYIYILIIYILYIISLYYKDLRVNTNYSF
jgi:hypothetical protein